MCSFNGQPSSSLPGNGSSGSVGNNGSITSGSGQSVTGNMTLAITNLVATWTTTTNEPAPSLLIKTTVNATWNARGPGMNVSSSQCDDGNQDSPVPDDAPGPPPSSSRVSSGTHFAFYANASANNTITLPSCTLTASFTAQGTNVILGNVSTSFAFDSASIGISPIGGIVVQGMQHYLVGQHCHASLSAAPLGCTVSNWHWSIAHGKPFKEYTPTTASATYTQLGSERTDTLDVWFADQNTGAMMTCQFDLALPANSLPAAGLTGNTATLTFAIEKSTGDMGPVYIGTVNSLPDSVHPTAVQLQTIFDSTGSGDARGLDFERALLHKSE